MKRLLALMASCLVVGLSGYWLTRQRPPTPELVDFLPAETAIVLEGDNLAHTWGQWRQSLVGEQLRRFDLVSLLSRQGLPESFTRQLSTFGASIEQVTKMPLFAQLFTRKAAVALLPDPSQTRLSNESMAHNLVVLVRVPKETVPLQWFEDSFGPVRSTSVSTYQRQRLVTLQFDHGIAVSYCLTRQILIASLTARSVQRCINQSLQHMVQNQTGLRVNQRYHRLKTFAGAKADPFLFANFQVLSPFPYLGKDGEESPLQQIALFHQHDGGKGRFGALALIDQERLSALTNRYHMTFPVERRWFQYISPETEFLFWTNWFNLQSFWELVQNTGTPEVTSLLANFSTYLAHATEQTTQTFFDVFGSEFGVFITRQQEAHQSPRSMACVAIEVRDRGRVEALLRKMLADLQAVTVISEKAEIVSVILAGGLLQPAYSLMGNMLVFADRVDLIEQVHRYIVQSDQAARDTVREGSNVILFLRTGQIVQRLLPLLTLLAKGNGGKTDILTPETRVLIQQIVLPALKRMESIETSRLRSYAHEDELALEIEYTMRH